MKVSLAAVLLCILCSASVHAAALTYTEATDFLGGDFPSSGSPNIGALGVGLNTINGTVSGAITRVGYQDDFEDTFSVALPAGLVINSGQLVITNFTYGPYGYDAPFPGSSVEPLESAMPISGNGTYALTAFAPYSSSGSLNFDITSSYSCANIFFCGDGGFSYSLQYDVTSPSSVPEPSGFFLAGLGVVAILRQSRRLSNCWPLKGAPSQSPRIRSDSRGTDSALLKEVPRRCAG